MENQLLRQIPKVDELLRCPALAGLAAELPASAVANAVRQVLDTLRTNILSEAVTELPSEEVLCAQIAEACRAARLPSLRGVINATGVVLHTNLGRACLSDRALAAAADAAQGYSTLEYDLASGNRGQRYIHVEPLLCRLTGTEAAFVVNNNAAAVLLIAAVLSPDECRRFARTAHELELEVLLEVHTPSELSRLNGYVDMLGVNNRDLGTFHTDVENSFRMADLLRREVGGGSGPLPVSESGISDPETVVRLREAGFRGFLMGEAFMKSGDPGRALAEFIARLKEARP